jgi:pimeloyl-ACP methyl ester carboxylesterase
MGISDATMTGMGSRIERAASPAVDGRDGDGAGRQVRHMDHPMFVPVLGEYIASVLSLPDSDPRGLVVLLQGLGAARSHKNRVWTRTARVLADRGIASVRMDYPDMGDSTGVLRADLEDLPVEEVEAVTRIAMEAAGVNRFAVVGNCMGLRTGFALASRANECVTVASILLGSAKPLLRGQGYSASGRAVKVATKRLPTIAGKVRRLLPSAHLEQRLRLLPEVETVLRKQGGFFLFFGSPENTKRFEENLQRLPVHENGNTTARIGFRAIEAAGTAGFRIPVALQPALIESVVGWMDGVFPGGGDAQHRGITDVGEGAS